MKPWKQLKIYLSEAEHWKHQPLYKALIEEARQTGLAGATVTRAIEGYGGKSHVRTSNILALSEDLPLIITIVDEAEKIRLFYESIQEMVPSHLVILESVEVLQHPADE